MQNQTNSLKTKAFLWTCYPIRKDRVALLIILLLATFLRFNGLNEPGLWLDEVSYTTAAQRPIIDQIINSTATLGGYLSVDPTLSAIPFSLSLKLGSSNFLARFPAAIFGILSIPLLYKLTRTMFSKTVGFIAILLFCFSSFHILYSQEARSYAQFVFFSMASFLFLYQINLDNHLARWVLYTIFTWAGVSTNHLMIFVIVIQGLFLMIDGWRNIVLRRYTPQIIKASFKTIGLFLVSLVIIFMLRVPWYQDFTQRQCAGCTIGRPSYPLDLINGFTQSIQAFAGNTPLTVSIFVILCLLGLTLTMHHFPKSGIFLICWLGGAPLITTFGLWFISQFFHQRYAIWGLPALLIATAVGLAGVGDFIQKIVSRLKFASPRIAATAGFVGMSLLIIPILAINLQQASQNPAFKQSWPLGKLQEATNYIAAEANINDAIIGVPNAQHLRFYLQYTRPDLIYLDASSKTFPEQLNGRWYIFYNPPNIPVRWTQLNLKKFNDILVVYLPGTCKIEGCLKETELLFSEIVQVNPGSELEKKIKVMLSGLTTLSTNTK